MRCDHVRPALALGALAERMAGTLSDMRRRCGACVGGMSDVIRRAEASDVCVYGGVVGYGAG